ncbi:helix-hairpin-helix domain-containing protein [Natronorubrum thiooxidans]|uniref:DNA repair exonuclease SbcCD nuclease subunit n=1 Tax=Natronorubrum thiooxidans TaxID=308853 RepID=A0A1N7H835_9EURY|nr:DNA repair exonuclease SbcCD nuclease subunit [Natronorubrum thiooxidans]
MTTRLLHTTDTFLDRKNMGRKSRLKDYLAAFKQAIAHALRKNVDGVIHTGDLFWTRAPTEEVVEGCKKPLRRLAKAGIPFWLVYGDRDDKLATGLLNEFREEGLLRRLTPEWHTIGDVSVHGIDATTDLRSSGHPEVKPPRPRIACAHEEVAVSTLNRVLGSEVDALLLGDQEGSVDRTESGCRILSPGSPERMIGKWTTETGAETSAWSQPRHVNIYTISEQSISVESSEIDARDYEGIEIRADAQTTMQDVKRKLDQFDLKNKAVLLILRGENGPSNPSRDAIQDELSARAEIARVYDRRDDVDASDGTSGGSDATTGAPLDADGGTNSTPAGITVKSVEITRDDINKLDVADGTSPDSSHLAVKFDRLKAQIENLFRDISWFESFNWSGDPGSPYIGPPNSDESDYLWLGMYHDLYRSLGTQASALQFEFGIDMDSNRGFFDRSIICGLYLGPWVKESVAEDIADHLWAHHANVASFLTTQSDYILVTGDKTWQTLTPDIVTRRADHLSQGFALTLDLSLEDLYACDDLVELVGQAILEVLPLYYKLAGVDRPNQIQSMEPIREDLRVHEDPTHDAEGRSTLQPTAVDADVNVEATVESIETHSSILDSDDIERSLNNLVERGASRDEALRYVRRYALEMERGDGLYAINGLGPVAGYALAQAGITTPEELASTSLDDVKAIDGLLEDHAQRILENARDGDLTPAATEANAGSSAAMADTASESNVDVAPESTGGEPRKVRESRVRSADTSRSRTTDDLPVATHDGQEVPANQLSECYEAIRSVRKVLSTVMQLPGTAIDPDDLTDPCVQYYVLLEACISGHSELDLSGYGQQHRDRLSFRIDDYRHAFGDGDWVTKYHTIDVAPYREETQNWLEEKTYLEDTQRFVRPIPPGIEQPLPESVGSVEDLRYALEVLIRFPAYPPLPTENGATDRTIPVETLYTSLFGQVDGAQLIDVETLSGPDRASREPITGPVADATPTSKADAESVLLDYGKLTHLYKQVEPPTQSPVRRPLPVFGLDWYRSASGSFDALRDLAKHGKDDPVSIFRPRLRDMVYRRFLRDRWEYDYITVVPGHEAGSLSPQLVELAQDSVLETSTLYSPLLERTETTERQREKSREGRKEVARNPEATLRARASLDGETVILFDDICTSGNSLLAGAHLLREAGADRVVGLTLGFTPGEDEMRTKEIKNPNAYASEIIAGLE